MGCAGRLRSSKGAYVPERYGGRGSFKIASCRAMRRVRRGRMDGAPRAAEGAGRPAANQRRFERSVKSPLGPWRPEQRGVADASGSPARMTRCIMSDNKHYVIFNSILTQSVHGLRTFVDNMVNLRLAASQRHGRAAAFGRCQPAGACRRADRQLDDVLDLGMIGARSRPKAMARPERCSSTSSWSNRRRGQGLDGPRLWLAGHRTAVTLDRRTLWSADRPWPRIAQRSSATGGELHASQDPLNQKCLRDR